jgi:hypothetical protein
MFASKTPRDLNHDHRPYRLVNGRLPDDRFRVAWNKFYVHDPRPEFDHAQHNEPNPILVAFRADLEDDVTPRERVLWWLAYGIDHYSTATDVQCDHARRVLTRLADLEVTK